MKAIRMKQTEKLPQTGFVRLPTVLYVTGIGKSKIWAMSKDGTFPKPYKLATRITAWKVDDLRAWIESRKPEGVEVSHAG